ncbi:GNAT family N-acetyltransferase [candidate division KSB1 bacterium]|nr:GNAT family N-acetyltransferase [candidate division KSB1 bacterium]
MVIRDAVRPSDLDAIREIVTSTAFFNAAEIDVAVELIQERLSRGEASGYHFLFAEIDDKTLAYSCYGLIAGTAASFDLYWIAMHNDFRGRGIGKMVLDASEAAIARMGGHRIYVETSSRPQYVPTRGFYQACGYVLEAVLQDFYAPGDSKCIFVKAV